MSRSVEESQLLEDSEDGQQEPKTQFLNKKFEEIFEKHPHLSADQAFHYEYCKLYIQTLQISSEIEKSRSEIAKLKEMTLNHPFKPRKFTSQLSNNGTSDEERRKRVRRTANEIARHYVCKVEKCQKSYGSEGSLNQHIKIKHPELLEHNC